MAIVHPTTTANIGFEFGTYGGFYPDYTWKGVFYPSFHGGIDYWGPLGFPIWATANGTVLYAGYAVPYIGAAGGNGVVIAHGENMKSIYGHMDTVTVVPGQQVVAGSYIGTMGESGIANGVNHLHFEIRTTTAAWGEDYENPYNLMIGGTEANNFGQESYDIPWVEPAAGSTVRLALCIPQGDGSFALPTAAAHITGVYFDRLKVMSSMYTVQERSGTLFIIPTGSISAEVEVRADYVT